jgi:hypothetical protein
MVASYAAGGQGADDVPVWKSQNVKMLVMLCL